jgi:hypothetical protein
MTPDPPDRSSPRRVTTACHSVPAPLPRPRLPAAGPRSADAPAPPPLRPRCAAPPGTGSARTRATPAPVAVRAAGRRPGESGWKERDPGGSNSRRMPPACAPASRSRAGTRCDACPGRADAASSPPAAGRTTPPTARRTGAPRPARRSAGRPPSRCCRARGWYCPCPRAPADAGSPPAAAPATGVAATLPPPDAAGARDCAARISDLGTPHRRRGCRSPDCPAAATPAPGPA